MMIGVGPHGTGCRQSGWVMRDAVGGDGGKAGSNRPRVHPEECGRGGQAYRKV
jgi:hypothetical protein